MLFGIDQPDKVFWTNSLTLAANIVLNLVLVPGYGIVGAAAATFLTGCVAAISQVLYLHSYISLNVDWTIIGWQVGLALIMAIVVQASTSILTLQNILDVIGLISIGVILYGSGLMAHEGLRERLLNMRLW